MLAVQLLRILLEREHLVKLHGKSKILHTSPEDCNSVSGSESVRHEKRVTVTSLNQVNKDY